MANMERYEEYDQRMAPAGNGGNMTAAQGLTQNGLQTTGEVASVAMSARVRAEIEARCVLAMRNPRDWLTVRDRLLKACARPKFAQVARYRKPIGQGVEGPSIRLAEEAARCMGNIHYQTVVISDTTDKRVLRVTAMDLESNLTPEQEIVLQKTVERRQIKPGDTVLSSRQNSQGQTTYTIVATEDDLLNKQNAMVSKALRTLLLRLLPGDILEEAQEECIATLQRADAVDPDKAIKTIADSFSVKLRVSPADLKEYLGHEIGQCAPNELLELRAIYAEIADGGSTWAEVIEHRRAQRGAKPPAEGEGASAAVSDVKAKLEARTAAMKERAAATAAAKQAPKKDEGPKNAAQAASGALFGDEDK